MTRILAVHSDKNTGHFPLTTERAYAQGTQGTQASD